MNLLIWPRCVTHLVCFAALAAFCVNLSAQQNWRWANSLPASEQWKDVAFGNGVYVAVGLDATIATSTDASTWTIRRMSTAQMALNSVTFANGLFVAVGAGTPSSASAALIMTSANGIDWTINETVASTINGQLFDVINGGGTWAISGTSRVLTSPDGLTWTSRGIPASVIPGSGAFGAGRFVFSANNNSVIVSTDAGATWTRTAVAGALGASSPFLPDVTFGNGKFVAIGRDSSFMGVAYTSTDASTWTQSSAIAGSNNGFISVVTDGTKFVAAGGAGVFMSADGNAWIKQTSALPTSQRNLGPQAENVSAAAATNGQFFVLGIYGSITTSSDGVTWTRRSTGTVNDLSGLVYDGARFVATGSGGTVLTSADGSTWTLVPSGTTSNFGKLVYSGGRYVTADFSGILSSTNLTSWTAVTGTTFDRYVGVAYGNGRFVAAYSATLLGTRTSADGVTWTTANNIPGTGGNTSALVFGGGVFVMTTGGGSGATKILSSTDGAAWTDRTPAGITNNNSFDSLAAGAGRFVALTFDRKSVTSTDGVAWTVNTLPASPAPTLSTIQFVGTQFVARGSGYGASSYVSTDGVTWTLLDNSTAPNNGGTNMVLNGDTVVAVGSSGIILRGDSAAPVSPNAPKVTAAPQSQTISSGGTAVFSVSATSAAGGAFTYQWRLNGAAVAGAAGATYVLRGATAAHAGSYTVVITNSFGSTTSAGGTLTISANPDFGRISNLSVLTNITATEPSFTVGTVVGGGGTSGTKALLVRAVGPSLSQLGVGGALSDPKLDVFVGQTVVATNDNWAGVQSLSDAFTAVGAFGYTSASSKDAAVYQPNATATAYTVTVSGVGGATGAVIAEVYDSTSGNAFTASTPRLTNVSVLKSIPAGGSITEGFTIGGSTAKTVLIRAIGPGLSAVGVNSGTLADPSLTLFNGASVAIASNDNWGGDNALTAVGTAVGAFAISSSTSKDAMLLITLPPGGYTAQAAGVGGTGGLAIVEVYEVP